MFESLQNFWHNTTDFFESGYNWIKDEVHAGYDYITSGAKTIAEAPNKIVQTIYNDAKQLISGDADLNHVLDRGSHTIDNMVGKTGEVIQSGQEVIGSTISNTAESLSNPLVIGGLAALAFLLKEVI